MSNDPILDKPIEEINVPVMQPTRYTPRRKPAIQIERDFNKFADWILSLVSKPIKRNVNKRVKKLKKDIKQIYSRYGRLSLYEREAPLHGFLKTHRIDGKKGYDRKTFTQYIRPRVIKFLSERKKPFQVKFIFTCRFRKGFLGKVEYNYGYFHTNIERIMEDTDLGEIYNIMIAMCLEKISKFQNKGSGWQFEEVVSFDVNVDPFEPIGGSSYFPLPAKLAAKKAIINVQNKGDNECFKWAVTLAVYQRKVHPERWDKELIENSKELKWGGIDFPTPLTQITRFEKQNQYSINVYGYTGTSVYPLRISKTHTKGKREINLILPTNGGNQHYCWIKNMSRLTSSQTSKHNGKRYLCKYCVNSLPTEQSLQKHIEYCSNEKAVRVEMPEKGTMLSFKNYHRKMRVPFVVYADFEAFTESISTCCPDESSSYTKQYQKHRPSSFCYYIKCFDDKLFPPVRKYYTIRNKDENIGKIFVKSLEKDLVEVYKKFKWLKKMIPLTREEGIDYITATVCHICGDPLLDDKNKDNIKVRDHCHLTGKYRGAAHSKCNLNFIRPNFFPVIFHNLSGYDTHMFIKDLGGEGKIECIAKTEEKYISFTKEVTVGSYRRKNVTPAVKEGVAVEKGAGKRGKEVKVKINIRFIDSYRFMPSSLRELSGNLNHHRNLRRFFKGRILEILMKGKAFYPYDYTNSVERLNETSLPPRECFYSKLNDEHISVDDLALMQEVWDVSGMKTMRDFHDLYLKTDVLLLADVFEEFREVCLDNYQLDPAWYYTSPSLAWDACLKMTQVELELLHDYDILLMVEKGIRGVSMISTRYGEANNKYMKDYNPSLPSKHIIYLDANNLYGWAMSKKLPTHGFKWMEQTQLINWENIPCILEVDLEYPHNLHDLHNDYPLAPEHVEMNGVEKLIPNLNDKKKYVVHYEALKLYVKYGLRITKIHRGITFRESAWLKGYIDLNTQLRKKSKNNFESNFFKLMNNSVFGKTIENVRKYTDIKLATTQKQVEKYIYKPNYIHRTTFSDHLVAIHMAPTTLKFRKPVYLGMCILDLPKTLMYEFHYEYIKSKYGDKAKLLFTDTDSLMYEIGTEDFYKDISHDVHSMFDTSNYPKEHPSGIETGVNKKVIGLMKDEAGGEIITKFVGLRAKNYAFLLGNKEQKKCKGIKKNVTENNITFKDYETCLFTNTEQLRKMNVFRSRLHDVYTEEVNKIALSANDDKRVILQDGVHTMAYGHFKTLLGGGSVSSGTTCNSSLTNPLLGAPSDK